MPAESRSPGIDGPWPVEQAGGAAGPPLSQPRHPPRDALDLRHAWGRFATGVTIVTCRDGQGARIGLTVNSFASLSLSPPLLLWSLRLASPNLAAFTEASHFAVNVLAQSAMPLARYFAAKVEDRFALGRWGHGEGGVPVLEEGAVAVLECRRTGMHEAGDHRIFLGEVVALRTDDGVAPLLFRGGRYHQLGAELG